MTLATLRQKFLLLSPLLIFLVSCVCSSCAPDKLSRISQSELREINRYKTRKVVEKRQLGILHFREGKKCFSKGKIAEAFKHFTQSAKMIPDWDLPYLELAMIHPLWDNDQQATLDALKIAISINPNNPRTHLMLGSIYIQLKKYKDAEESFLKALKLKDNFREAHLRLANLYKDQKEYYKAVREYETLILRQPDNAFLHSILAFLYEQLGKLDEAEMHFRSLIACQPDAGWVFYKLAQFYERTGHLDKAQKAYKRAEELNPSSKKRQMRPMLPSRK